MNHLENLEKQLNISFKKKDLLKKALTHKSFSKQHQSSDHEDNERLEFLGDAILKFVVSNYIYRHFKTYPEGKLTKLRANIVSDDTLFEVAKSIQLNQYIFLSHSEEKSSGSLKQSVLSDALEALIGAYYLDSGIKTSDFIVNVIIKFKLKDLESNPISDYKSLVQEFVQKNTHMLPNYTTIKEDGPEHQKTFTVELIFTVNKKRHSFW